MAASFQLPHEVVLDSSNNAYVAEPHSVRRVSAAGMVVTIAGRKRGWEDGVGAVASFQQLRSIVLDEASGMLYVADWHRVRSVRLEDHRVTTVAGEAAGSL